MSSRGKRRLSVRLPDSVIDDLQAYCEHHKIKQSHALRIALARLLRKKPTASEVKQTESEYGNPAFRDQDTAREMGRRGLERRWGE